MTRNTPNLEPIRTCEKPKTEKVDRDKAKSKPAIIFKAPNTEKAEKNDIASKPDDTPKKSKTEYEDKKIERSSQKPKDKPKNKIEPRKIDIQKEPRHKIQRQKSNPLTPSRNKIERPKIDLQKEPRIKIQYEKFNPLTPTKNKIERPTFDLNGELINKIQPQRTKNKIERNPASEPKNSAKPEVSQLSLEKIKGELKKFNWKTISENWTVKVSVNKEITLKPYELPSKENPLYKHKQWLQTVYNHKTWNLNDNKLKTISGVSHATIYNWRRKLGIPTKQAQQKPFKDGTHKECGRCHQVKPYNEFKRRNDKRKSNPYLRSNCNVCKNELNRIYVFKNKLRILTNIYKGYDKIKCSECETKVNRLPAFDFHHPDNNLKKLQRIRTNMNWNKTKEILEKEKVIPLCKNCHAIKKTTVFNKHKELILRKNDFENSLEGIENNIHQYVKTNFNSDNPKSQLIQIKSWIKKRIVIEKLYNGKCIGCGEEKLPSLQFHHKNPEKKTYRSWSDINNLNISKIIKKFKEDTAICLCANCHSMIESRHFKENMGEIIKNRDLPELRSFYKKLNQRIKNYSFPNQPEKQKTVKSHNQKILSSSEIQLSNRKEIELHPKLSEKHVNGSLKYQYGYGEAWKKYLTHITKLLNEGKEVQTKNLAQSVGVNTRNTRKNIQKLIAKGLISINGEHNNRTIILTENGLNESKKIYPYIYI